MYQSGVGRSQPKIIKYINGYKVRKEGMSDLTNDNLVKERCKVMLVGES